MLFAKPQDASVYPNTQQVFNFKDHDATLKLEQDIHLDNTKYAATGSLYVAGDLGSDLNPDKPCRLSLFSMYFDKLNGFVGQDGDSTLLVPDQHWNEVIYDITTDWVGDKIDSWMLVTRWNTKDKTLVESELSFKFQQEDGEWNLEKLNERCRLYDALGRHSLFKPLPPIFTFADPVSSFEITKS